MDNIQKIVLVVHTLIALLIIIMVLLQRGKGADAGAAFGSGASGTVFGARGSSSFFSRTTAILATAFFVSSLTLAYLSSQATSGPSSLLDDAPAVEEPAVEQQPIETEPSAGPTQLPTLEDDAAGLPTLDDDAANLPSVDESPEVPAGVPAGDEEQE